MYTADALLDLHDRSHRSFGGIVKHCLTIPAEVAERRLDGFAYPTLREQLYHVLGAERYWLGVLNGQMILDHDLESFPTLSAIAELHSRIRAETAEFVRSCSNEALNAPRLVRTWSNNEVSLVPARIIVRVSTHIYDHKGQLSVMCRQLGHPIPAGLDFPLL